MTDATEQLTTSRPFQLTHLVRAGRHPRPNVSLPIADRARWRGGRAVLLFGENAGVPDVLLAPYLPLAHAVAVGPWQFVPFRALEDADVVPGELARPVMRLIDAYRLPSGGSLLGAVAFPAGAQVGAPFERATMPRLGRALLAGALSSNPTMAVSEEDADPNAGHALCTAENALLYGHPLGRGDSYVTETGVLMRVTAVHYAHDEKPLPPVDPPVELPRPLFSAFDDELADAAYRALDNGAAGRRLTRALDWYRIALSNAEAVTIDVRVGATRSALEILTNAGDKTQSLVRNYGRLMRRPDTAECAAPTRPRQPTTRPFGPGGPCS